MLTDTIDYKEEVVPVVHWQLCNRLAEFEVRPPSLKWTHKSYRISSFIIDRFQERNIVVGVVYEISTLFRNGEKIFRGKTRPISVPDANMYQQCVDEVVDHHTELQKRGINDSTFINTSPQLAGLFGVSLLDMTGKGSGGKMMGVRRYSKPVARIPNIPDVQGLESVVDVANYIHAPCALERQEHSVVSHDELHVHGT
eukprot:TRINITY_DN55850_c0_g1_i1.p1 TRINITY_DN55850_c0_g1~~TRINITY_DN55850_c0_g1_i1.p1  ORF type:complete len:206 (+),score=9.35 TRINITY_DN55850_c0_g1_i1:27-620(+)